MNTQASSLPELKEDVTVEDYINGTACKKVPLTADRVVAAGRNIAVLYDKPPKEQTTESGLIIASDERSKFDGLVTGVVISIGRGGAQGEGHITREEGPYVVPDSSLMGRRIYYKLLDANVVKLDNGDEVHIIDCEDALASDSVESE